MSDVQPALLPDDPTADDVQETVPGLSSWEFINAVPTAEDVMALLKTVRPVYGIKAEDFADFVQALPSTKKRPGAGRNEERLQVYTLYMSVAGRTAMLNAAQEKHGWRVDHEPEPVTPTGVPGYLRFDDEKTLPLDADGEPVGGRIVYREYITIARVSDENGSTPLGRKPGTAWVPALGGSNAVGSNRFEKVETSARGRALAAWGFGVLPGSGIASLEEMQGASENSPRARAPRERGRGARTETRRPRAELITEVLTRAEQVRQLRGSTEEEMTTRLAEYVKKTFGLDIAAEGYSDDEGKPVVVTVEWDKVKDGQLQLTANQLLDTLTKLEADRSAV